MHDRAMRMWVAVGALGFAVSAHAAAAYDVARADLSKMTAGWGTPRANASVEGAPLRVGGVAYARGIGTHADSALWLELGRQAERFTASVGVDDEVVEAMRSSGSSGGTVEFSVSGDGRVLWSSGKVKAGEPARKVDVDVAGVRQLLLQVTVAGDGDSFDHADWCDATIRMQSGEPKAIYAPRGDEVILTPPPPPTPRIVGAKIYGTRPGHPFLYRIPATGTRPMVFGAEGLPDGLSLDPQTGIISGAVAQAGEHYVRLTARNALGETMRSLRIVAGDTLALTPPMGWNSWNCFAHAVDADKVKAAADALIKSGLADHGWSYINIDDFWSLHPQRMKEDPSLGGPGRDAKGHMVPNPRFEQPDKGITMKGLADYVHSLGLKIGIYSSPGSTTCGGCLGSYGHELQDAEKYAEWGMDYLKYDWCSYEQVAGSGSLYILMKPYLLMGDALKKQKRDIVYSLCQYGMGYVSAWGERTGGQLWRTTYDITDTWKSMSDIGFRQQRGLEMFAGPGRWNDPDMLVVGQVGWGPRLHPTRLTPHEQYTHVTLWSLLAAPLLIGCDLTKLDPFTFNLLSNDEVIEVNQDPLGRQAARVQEDATSQVWAKGMEDGSLAVGAFNLGGTERTVVVQWASLNINGSYRVRDLWRQKDLDPAEGNMSFVLPPHGCMLIRLWKAD